MKVKEENEKAGLKLNIQKVKTMSSGPITLWQIDGKKKIKTVTDFIFPGSKIIVDGGCRHEIKRHLLLEIKSLTNLDSILKSRDMNLSKLQETVRDREAWCVAVHRVIKS